MAAMIRQNGLSVVSAVGGGTVPSAGVSSLTSVSMVTVRSVAGRAGGSLHTRTGPDDAANTSSTTPRPALARASSVRRSITGTVVIVGQVRCSERRRSA